LEYHMNFQQIITNTYKDTNVDSSINYKL